MKKIDYFFLALANKIPNLKIKLKQAELEKSPEEFVKICFRNALFLSLMSEILLFIFALKEGISILLPCLLFPLLVFALFFYFLKYLDLKIRRKVKRIEQDLIFATRHLLIELEAGVPLFNALMTISKDYGEISRQIKKAISKVNYGAPLDVALQEIAENNPSEYFRRVLWQLINAERSGSDIARALSTIIDQISQEQIIDIRRYGQKLNPFAMLYLMFAVIVPSLGITLLLVIGSFFRMSLGEGFLIMVLILLGFMQFMFFSIISSSRPNVGV